MTNKKLSTPKATKNCERILAIIRDFIENEGYSPTARDIMKRSKLKSVSSVHAYICELENQGLITKANNKSRSIKLAGKYAEPSRKDLPLVGKVAAGSPILAEENISENLSLPEDLAKNGSFVLEVKGNSMIDAGIYNGDKIIVKQQNVADNGDIVVALIDDEATVKRFYKEKTNIRLHPENKRMKDIIVPNCDICGKVIGLYRSL